MAEGDLRDTRRTPELPRAGARNPEHIAAGHGFLAALAQQTVDLGWTTPALPLAFRIAALVERTNEAISEP